MVIRYTISEFYRNKSNRMLYAAMVVLIALAAAMVLVLNYFQSEAGFRYGNTFFAMRVEYTSMATLFFIIVFLAVFIDGNEKKQHTMKHSVAFGISRRTIYFSRLLVQLVLCLVVFAVVNTVLVLLAYGLLEHSNAGEFKNLIMAMAGCLPLYLSVLAITHCFVMSVDNPTTAIVYSLGILVVLPIIFNYLGMKVQWAAAIAYWMPYNLAAAKWNESNELSLAWDTAAGMRNCYISGLLITVVFCIIGVRAFQNKEVK